MDISNIGLGSTYRHKKSQKVYVVDQIIENKTTDTLGVIYHWVGAPKDSERNYFREWKDFKEKFKLIEKQQIKHSDLVANIWDISKKIVSKLKRSYNAPSGNFTKKDWKQLESEWFDYIKEKVGACDYVL